ncbi:hypothetical protein ACTI_58880 [Actinoplanes sp. OR16]|uniref:hypothetical protein n=1 Tax=Actinoplanes sp. OR16 TaxID=946334 RepID=UPI000F6E9E3D|nr:hypothetical protein [Actinoplanes sp. OR16]BBH69203.1 hypothetical protein ACTI_58880 [Actinoplanes sp. OR16]
MSQPVSDAVFELHGACVHSLRFSFAAPVDYPYAPAEVAADDPPPALFRRIQAVSPPPTRGGAPWQTGMTLDGRQFDPRGPLDRLADVTTDEGSAGLDVPDPETAILDWMFDVPRDPHTMAIPGADEGRYLLSVPYWNPRTDQTADYFATHRIDWATPPQDDWVAVSFDGFYPKDRDSADILIPLGACDENCR